MRRILPLVVLLAVASPAAAQDMPLSMVLLSGESWRPVAADWQSASALTSGSKGDVYVASHGGTQIDRIDSEGRVSTFARIAATGLCYGLDGRLYVSQLQQKRIVTVAADGKESVFAENLAATNLTVTRAGQVYATANDGVYLIGRDGQKRRVNRGIQAPWSVTPWLDQGTLVVGDAEGKHLYAFRIEKDGNLTAKEGYYTLRSRRGAWSLTVDSGRRLYAASHEGVQIFDPTGRMCGVLLRPERRGVTAVAFGGASLDRLYVTCGGNVYVRKTKAKGIASAPAKAQ